MRYRRTANCADQLVGFPESDLALGLRLQKHRYSDECKTKQCAYKHNLAVRTLVPLMHLITKLCGYLFGGVVEPAPKLGGFSSARLLSQGALSFGAYDPLIPVELTLGRSWKQSRRGQVHHASTQLRRLHRHLAPQILLYSSQIDACRRVGVTLDRGTMRARTSACSDAKRMLRGVSAGERVQPPGAAEPSQRLVSASASRMAGRYLAGSNATTSYVTVLCSYR